MNKNEKNIPPRNIRFSEALKKNNVTQGQLAAFLNITAAAVNERLNSEKEIDSISFMKAVWILTGEEDFDFLVYGEDKVNHKPSGFSRLSIKKVEITKEIPGLSPTDGFTDLR